MTVPSPRVDTSVPARVPDYMLVPVDGDGGDALTEAAVAGSDEEADAGEGDGTGEDDAEG